ncbi:MAG TPA: class I SAM-dependent methyltransferase [Ohtaekwangia sp.]
MPNFFQLKSYITYWLDAVNEHSLHSPFFFDFYTRILKGKSVPAKGSEIESIRSKFLRENTLITLTDLGAGAINNKTASRTVAQIAQTSLSSRKFSQFYARIIQHFKFTQVVELGTSLGINTLYLASIPGTKVTTFEGDPHLVNRAEVLFDSMGMKVNIIGGNLDKTLSHHLQRSPRVDLAFVDANHRYEPTLHYAHELISRIHEQSILILDDIHYSPEMEKAWYEIRNHRLVYGSVDLYRCGLLFFNPSLNKQHVVLQF